MHILTNNNKFLVFSFEFHNSVNFELPEWKHTLALHLLNLCVCAFMSEDYDSLLSIVVFTVIESLGPSLISHKISDPRNKKPAVIFDSDRIITL